MQNAVLALYGPQPRPLAKVFSAQGVQLGGVFLDSQYLLILAVTLVAVAFQFVLFEYTLLGKKLQATSQDKDMARLVGIPVAGMITFTFVYSATLGGLAGILVAPILFVSIGMRSTIALKAFSATIIGGFGDVTGAIVGGLLLGVVEAFAATYISVPSCSTTRRCGRRTSAGPLRRARRRPPRQARPRPPSVARSADLRACPLT